MKKKATINDIAELSNVSRTTISRYLNGKFGNMSQETRERIQKVIADLDYHPSRQARLLKSQHSSMIGIMVGDISNFYTSRLLKGILNRVKKSPYRLIIMDSDLSSDLEQKNLSKLIEEQVDGIILQPLGASSDEYQKLNHLPVVQIDRYVDPLIWPAVISDNFEKSKALVELAVNKDYQRIIAISPPLIHSSTRIERYEGLVAALQGKKVQLKEFIAPEAKDLEDSSPKFWQEMLPLLNDGIKTAIYTFNGPLLFNCVKFLKENDLSIPEKVGVVGFDDVSWGEIMGPGVTAIEQNLEKIGFLAAENLINNIEAKSSNSEKIVVESKLTIRKSL